MSKISKEGKEALQKNVTNPLNVMWEKIQKAGISDQCQPEYEFIFKFLSELDGWETIGPDTEYNHQVVIDGAIYTRGAK